MKKDNDIPQQTTLQTSKEKAILLLQVLAIFWLMAKGLGWKVWTKERSFPLVPIFDWISWPSWIHNTLFALSIVFLISLVFKPLNKTILICLFVTEIISCTADQNRWQPWEYQYLFTILIYIINNKNYQKLITCIVITMAGTYLYSGLGKLNEGYLALVWDNIFLKYLVRLPQHLIANNYIHKSGYITAFIELMLAGAIFFPKTKKIAAILLIIMHLMILIAIGPFGRNYNLIVWPWNTMMAIFLYIIFVRKSVPLLKLKEIWPGWNKLVPMCWFFLPALNYLGLWDNFLSSRLYSANLPLMAFCIKDSVEREKMKPYFFNGYKKICDGEMFVDLQTWAIREMNVPPYPELRVYKKIETHWRNQFKNSSTVITYYRIKNKTEVEIISSK